MPQDYSGLVINEIHYNPKDEIFNGDTIEGTNFEFIELKNIGSSDINIAGIEFSEGVETNIQEKIIIQPGGFCVIAENRESFQQKFGFVPDAVYSGKLSDKGEAIILNNPFGIMLDEVEYDDKEPWDVKADEGDFSLGLIDATSDNTDAVNWAVQDDFTTPKAENTFCVLGDLDEDGVCDDNDQCPNEDDAIIGTSCDDGDSCTTNDVYNTACVCEGVREDSDNDGVCDADDICPGGDDNIDGDLDGIPDACDNCPTDSANACGIPTYCTAQAINTNYEFIQKVSFKSIDNASGNNRGYGDFSGQSTNVSIGETVAFSLTPGFRNSAYNEAWTIWIDFNRDGDYTDAGENVYSNSSSVTLSGKINIPESANTGATGMRVAMQWRNAASSCGSFVYGEVEDYTVIISANGAPKLADELTSGNISIFPNPAVKEININLSEILDGVGEQMVDVSIYRLNGQLMWSKAVQTATIIQMDIEQLPNSQPYLLQLQSKSGKKYIKKFFKL